MMKQIPTSGKITTLLPARHDENEFCQMQFQIFSILTQESKSV